MLGFLTFDPVRILWLRTYHDLVLKQRACAARHDGMSGLIMHGMISWATPRDKRPCMIDADHMPTPHAKDSFMRVDFMPRTSSQHVAHTESGSLRGT